VSVPLRSPAAPAGAAGGQAGGEAAPPGFAEPPRAETPGAVVRTLLLTDLVGSLRLFERLGDQRAVEVSLRHDRVARDLLARWNGREIDKSDGFLLLFERPIDAVSYALDYHGALSALSRELGVELQSRAGIHLGEVVLRENAPADVARGAKPLEIEGLAKAVASRLMSLGQGRQTLLTRGAFDLARRAAVAESLAGRPLSWLAHGPYLFKGLAEPVEVFEVGVVGLSRLAVPPDSEKARRAVAAGDDLTLGWRPAPGLEVPRRPGWVIQEKLGEGGFGEVWRAAATKTGEPRVFKFCYRADRLRGLQREVTLFRILKETLGEREDIARVLDWNFETAPYFLESEYTAGGNLAEWAAEQGGLAQVPLPVRLELVAQVAVALAAAHSVGVLHKDVKPSNVLVTTGRDGGPRVRLTDFGIGLLTDRGLVHGITILGLTETSLDISGSSTGTPLYMAPELLEGRPATVQADVYALGVMLYQAVVGNFGHALAPGWQREVPDELLAEDIALLVDGSPERRLRSAGEVAERLRSLEARRQSRAAERQAAAAAAAARRALTRAQRRRKVAAAVAAAALVVLAVVTFLAVQAVEARREADRRRAQAEDLIRFMVGDLRGKLQPLGRLDVLGAAADRALRYFAVVPESDLTGEELLGRAQALSQIGEVRLAQGQLGAAVEAFRESLALTRRLTARNPREGRWQKGLGDAHFWLGNVRFRQGDLDGARREFRAYLQVAEGLVEREPKNPDWRLELAYAHSNLGSVLDAEGDLAGALAEYRTTLELKQALARARPEDTALSVELAKTHNSLGWALERDGQLAAAARSYRADLAIAQGLVEREPNDARWQWRLAVARNYLGALLAATGDAAGAQEQLEADAAAFESLVARDPSNTGWRNGLGAARSRLAASFLARGDAARALAEGRAAKALLAELAAKDPADRSFKISLAIARTGLGAVLLALGRPDGALDEAQAARSLLEPLVQANPGDRTVRRRLGEAALVLGRVFDRMGQADRAREAWGRAAEVLAPFARGSREGDLLLPWARALLYLGRVEEGRAAAARFEALGYRDPELRRQLQERR